MKKLLPQLLLFLLLAIGNQLLAQIPKLSSYPSATSVIYLDFDGHTVAGTSWNFSGPIYCGASGLDSSKITTVFNRVAEDFRPFNVNVTTDSALFLAAPIYSRIRVILTVTSSWYGSAGGVAFIGSFSWGDDTPCFVFTALHGYNVKNIAEAASHETGHTLGLMHQSAYDGNCIKTSDYNYGTGSGEIGWAPIMGVGYNHNMTLWNNGPNSYGCASMQNDLDVITSYNGFGYRNDEYGNNFGTATNVTFTGDRFTVNGVIAQNTDKDFIRYIQPSTGRFQLDAIPYNVGTGNDGSNLDLQITLYNQSLTELNVYNPGDILNSVIDTTLNGGTYFLKIEGRGNIYAPEYASIGSYTLQGKYTNTENPLSLRRLELSGSQSDNKHTLNWTIDADEQVTEQVLESSTDGRNFKLIAQPAITDRQAQQQAINKPVQYRLKVIFNNGKQYYSNIVTIPANKTQEHPYLIGNVVTSGIISIASPSEFNFSLSDLSGKTIYKGQLKAGQNTVQTPIQVAGIYIARYINETNQYTEKLVRQ